MVTAIVYGVATGIIRRVVWTDEPDTLADHVGGGEAILTAPDSVFVMDPNGNTLPDQDRVTAYFIESTGITPELDRCVVIDDGTGEVVNVVLADPNIDAIDGHTLFQDALGVPGSAPDENGVFQPLPPVAE